MYRALTSTVVIQHYLQVIKTAMMQLLQLKLCLPTLTDFLRHVLLYHKKS